ERVPNPLMSVDVKILRVQKLRDVVIHLRVNEHRPNDGFFGFAAMRDCRCGRRGGGIFSGKKVGHFFFGFFGWSGASPSGLLSSGLSKSSFSKKFSKTDKRSAPSFVSGA